MFNKIFRPKWQHRKAEVRIAALKQLNTDDPILEQLAGNDEDPAVRRHALRRICDLPCLARLLAAEVDEAVRKSGNKRLKRLLAGEEEASPELAVRLQLLQEQLDEEVLGYVLKHAAEAELRRAILDTVNRPSLLAEVALSDPSGELRLVALERIDRGATLERIAREAKGKDKRVARRAREKVEAMQIEAVRPERQSSICEALEQLVEQGGVDLIRFGQLQQDWEGLLPESNAELGRRFASACEAFAEAQSRFQAEAALAAQQRELCERIEELQRQVEGANPDLFSVESTISRLQQAWQSLESEHPSLNQTLVERFNQALSRTEQRRRERQARDERSHRLNSILADLGALTAKGNYFDPVVLNRLEDEWRKAVGGDKQGDTAELQSRFKQKLQQAQHRLEEQGQERERLKKELTGLLSQLEAALDEGQLQLAASSHDKIRNRTDKLRELGGTPGAAQQKRLQSVVARLNELRDWRRFGTNRAREELLEQMAALGEETLPPLKLADAVKALRDKWRQLDRKDGPAPEALWQAFDQAAEAAYEPCRIYFESQHQERSSNLEQRQRFIDELEKEFEQIDWQEPDWESVDKRLHQVKKQWQKLGGVERREWKTINDRFNQILERFEQHLGPQREREKMRREGLIASVEKLVEEANLEKALADTKAAQAAWRPKISSSPRVEQGLWRRFKSACDAVYARQREQVKAQRKAEHDEEARLQQIGEEISALADSLTEENQAESKGQLAELKGQWQEVNSQGLRHSKSLERRFDSAVDAFAKALKGLAIKQAEVERRLLLDKLAVCEALEGLLFDEVVSDTAELEATWNAFPPLRDTSFGQALEQRFEQALGALRDGAEIRDRIIANAAENLAQRLALCLQLELLAGVESPPAYVEERMQLQVAMLSEAMTGQLTEGERRDKAHQLLGDYLSIGPIVPQERGVLTVRLQGVLRSGII